MRGYLLDTNHLGHALRVDSAVRRRLRDAYRRGYRFGTCVPALCELEVGIQQRVDLRDMRRTLAHLLSYVRIWPIERRISERYGEIYLQLRRRGRVLSQVDLLLAALASDLTVTLLTTDRDFEALPDIPTENWITSP